MILGHEATITRLLLIDSTPPYEHYGPQAPAVVRERWHSYFHQQFDLPEKLIEEREEIYLRYIFRDWCLNKCPVSDAEVAEYVTAYRQTGALRGGFNYYRAVADEDPPQWQANAGRRLSTPFMFLFGTRRARTAKAMGAGPLEEAWCPSFPNGQAKHMGHYGHFLQWETPDTVNQEILAFLSA